MPRYTPALLLLFLPALARADDTAVVARVRPSVVTVLIPRRNGTHGTGAAVAVAPRLLATCAHVAGKRPTSRVRLADGTEAEATLLASDPLCDLALLRLDRDLPPLPFAAQVPAVGSRVLAFGAPYGYAGSVSAGIVSATGRALTLPTGADLKDLLQTDAAVNHGSSGGPLVNDRGELVGLITALRDGATGIGFAIPASQVQAFVARHTPTHPQVARP